MGHQVAMSSEFDDYDWQLMCAEIFVAPLWSFLVPFGPFLILFDPFFRPILIDS